ncbi:MAG: general substrate transporter [Benjaminiella poitrasii]|nr:MAG: general substrate transporter [Benjaminiella poitrasii]
MSLKNNIIDQELDIGDDKSSLTISDDEPKRFRKAVYVSALVAAIGGFLCGYDTGAVSGILAIPIFQSYFFTPDNLDYLQGLLLALYLMTAALGAFFTGFFCDRFSRKYSIMAASMIFCIGILFQIIGANFGLLLAGRLIGGFGSGLLNSAIPLYHSEIAPPDIRGRLISFFTLMSSLGQVVGYFVTFGTSYVASNWSWRGPWLLHLIVCVLFIAIMVTLPFSPRWLIYQVRYEEAQKVLMDLHEVTSATNPVVAREFDDIVQEIEFERSLGKVRYTELFVGKNLKRTLMAFFISISTSFTGSVAIGYYAPQMIQSAGLSDASTSIAATGGTGLFSMIMAFVSLQWFIDRVGRKPLFLVGAAVMGISMFVVGALFQTSVAVDVNSGAVTVKSVNARNAIIAFLYIFMGTYQFSWGTASYVYPAEIFNMRTRAKGLALTYGLNWAFSILITYCIPLFLAHTVSGVYFFFGACCCVCFVGCWFIPETKGKTLEEMEYVFGAKE